MSQNMNDFRAVQAGVRLTAQMLVDECADIDDGWQLGLRVVPERVSVGQILEPSYRWVDGDITDDQLGGTSAIALRSTGALDSPVTLQSAMDAIQQIGKYHGVAVALLGGHCAGWGEDDGEILIRDAEVMAYWHGAAS